MLIILASVPLKLQFPIAWLDDRTQGSAYNSLPEALHGGWLCSRVPVNSCARLLNQQNSMWSTKASSRRALSAKIVRRRFAAGSC